LLLSLPKPQHQSDARSQPALWRNGLVRDGWSEEFRAVTLFPTAFGCGVIHWFRTNFCGHADWRCFYDPCPRGQRWLCDAAAIDASAVQA
jgi:hypothetical protein